MTEAFPDRRDQLFGREADVHRLTDRASRSGLTAVVARPLVGKTWTLNEVARRLLEEGRYLMGYHESKASESSHLLYAVSNLYVRWLADSTMREQAISLWQRHKEGLVPRIGQMAGTLFKKLADKQLPEGVGAVVRSAFDGLAEAQKDLLSGGMQIAPLPYDQALSLTSLVVKVSGRRVVLILDAWEKSPSIRSEFATLEAFLKHQDAWPHTHVFLRFETPSWIPRRSMTKRIDEHTTCARSIALRLFMNLGRWIRAVRGNARVLRALSEARFRPLRTNPSKAFST